MAVSMIIAAGKQFLLFRWWQELTTVWEIGLSEIYYGPNKIRTTDESVKNCDFEIIFLIQITMLTGFHEDDITYLI